MKHVVFVLGLPSVLGSGRLTSQQTVFQKKTYSVPIKGREFEEKSSTQGGKGKDRKAQGIPKPASSTTNLCLLVVIDLP